MNETVDDCVIVVYARASDGDTVSLGKQLTSLHSTVPLDVEVVEVKDRGSGLNDNRPGLKKVMDLAKTGEVKEVRFVNSDRLTRFGYRFLKQYFQVYDVKLVETAPEVEKTLEEGELLQDFMNLVASFSGKFYRIRGYKQQRRLLSEAQEQLS